MIAPIALAWALYSLPWVTYWYNRGPERTDCVAVETISLCHDRQ